jgi:hypothetical protein
VTCLIFVLIRISVLSCVSEFLFQWKETFHWYHVSEILTNINGKSFSFAFAYHTYLCSCKVVCFYMPSLLLKTCPCLSVAVCLHLCLKLTITSIILCTSYLWADMAVFPIFIIRQEWYFSLGSIDIMITVLNWELYMLLFCCHPCAFISWNVSSWKLEIYVS